MWRRSVFNHVALPGDPASLHEAGWISSSFADRWVAAWTAASSAVGVRAVGTLPVPVWHTNQSHQQWHRPMGAYYKSTSDSGSPGGVLPVVRGLGLAGSSVFGGRGRGWTPTAPGAAALSEVCLAPDFVGWRVPWRRWCAPVACLTPTGLVVSLGRVATFSPGGNNPADVKQFSLICKAKAVRSSSDKSLKVHNCNGRLTFCGDESSSLCKYGCAGSGSSHCCEQGSGSSYSDLSGLLSSLTPCSESSL